MSLRIYGDFSRDSSTGRVTQGFASVFTDAYQYALDYWGNDLDEGRAPEGATATDAFFLGSLMQLNEAKHFYGSHKRFWLMLAPNSNMVGPLVESWMRDIPYIMTPSKWAKGVLESIFPKKEIFTVPHGVEAGFERDVGAMRQVDSSFSMLHLSSSIYERKGTMELVEAWGIARPALPEDSKLLISAPGESTPFLREFAQEKGIRDILFQNRLYMGNPKKASKVYSGVDFVIQPSRGEAFGLVPLEARACGTPVVMTDCTGHSEHVDTPGVVRIATGEMSPIDDFPGAMAPRLQAADIATSILTAYERRRELSEAALKNAHAIRTHWSWKNQLKEFYEYFGKLL